MNKDDIRAAMKRALLEAAPDQKVYALALLAHNITISIRGVFADQPNGNQTASKLNGLNEIQHRVTSRLMNLAQDKDEWSDESFVDFLLESAQQGGCEEELLSALRYTLTPLNRRLGVIQP